MFLYDSLCMQSYVLYYLPGYELFTNFSLLCKLNWATGYLNYNGIFYINFCDPLLNSMHQSKKVSITLFLNT